METAEARNELASQWMKRGIALLHQNTTDSLTEALRYFDRAIAVRQTLPISENAWYRYVLAAGWMNRADALTRLGTRSNLTEALRSYEKALVLLQTLVPASNPLFPRRLALAWMNRGVTLQAQGSPDGLRAALTSFERAISILRHAAEADPSLLASALTNYGNVLLQVSPSQFLQGKTSANEALALLAGLEEEQIVAAEVGLKARHALCRALALQLTETSASPASSQLVEEATDAVEDGLKLAHSWEAQGNKRLRGLSLELFRFGARIYQLHQPQFLAEFVLEQLDKGLVTKWSAAFEFKAALSIVLRDIQAGGFAMSEPPRFHRLLQTLRRLLAASNHLADNRPPP